MTLIFEATRLFCLLISYLTPFPFLNINILLHQNIISIRISLSKHVNVAMFASQLGDLFFSM